MPKFFTRARFGAPQHLAGLLLLVFIAECGWLVAHIPPGAVSADELVRVHEGLEQWHRKGIAGTRIPGMSIAGTNYAPDSATGVSNDADPQHSPLWYLIESAPLAIFRLELTSSIGMRLARAPYILAGALLGASLWYVSRRLYGNAGGYIALGLYCFSPAVIRSSALWLSEPNITGAWGTFGAVFTAIAVSHTLYAPREVVLWNWRRIVLLGISLAIAVGSQFSLALIVPLLLAFMLYVAVERWAAVVVILLAACALGLVLLLASYFFHLRIFWGSLAHAQWLDLTWPALGTRGAWLQIAREILTSGPVLAVLAPAALAAYVCWPRARYFGNTAPLIVVLLFVLLRGGAPHEGDSVYGLIAAVFLFVFVAGIAADFLETRYRELAGALVAGLVAANGIWNLIGLAEIR
jgi:hypothetical protein